MDLTFQGSTVSVSPGKIKGERVFPAKQTNKNYTKSQRNDKKKIVNPSPICKN